MELQEVSGKYKYGYLSNITEEDVFYSNDKLGSALLIQRMEKLITPIFLN